MSTFRDMVSLVKTAWPAREFIVPCLEGPAGIGKTAAIKQAASELKEEGLATGKVVTIIASQILPNEVSGITMPVPETKAMEIFDHYRLSSLVDGDILFFDELLEADQLVLSACLTLIESRELMSGHKLPDVMIVAATNPTIKPNMLKENIRQRFVWKKFKLDKQDCRAYIHRECGFDIGTELADCITCEGEEYNILSPRSMTKMACWIAQAKDHDEAVAIAGQIDTIWRSQLGTKLLQRYEASENNPMNQVKRAIRKALAENKLQESSFDEHSRSVLYDDEVFEQTDMAEIMEILQSLPEWVAIEDQLSKLEFKEEDEAVILF